MNSFNTNAHDFRSSKRKCFSLTCSLIFVLLMSQASCRPSETDSDNGSSDALTYNDYVDPDDIDWKNFAAVETTSKAHPIIYYKEDIVSEDYDPSKEKKKNRTTKEHDAKEIKPHHSQRKYKEISRHHRHRNQTENYRYIKPEKVYFDINPIEDHDGIKEVSSNDENDNKFNEDDIHMEVISLVDEENTNTHSGKTDEEEFNSSKNLLNKKTKKYNHRYRRNVPEDEHVRLRHKRNPYYERKPHYANQFPSYAGVFHNPQQYIYPQKSVVRSPIYHNAGSPPSRLSPDINTRFGLGDEIEDRPIWATEPLKPATEASPDTRVSMGTPPTMRPLPPRRPPPPLLQRGDEDFVPSSSSTNSNAQLGPRTDTAPSRGLPPRRTPPPLIQHGDEDFVTSPPVSRWPQRGTATQSTTRPVPPAPGPRVLSACVYAISSCCDTRKKIIRYQCFERLGCDGAFWDLNPCADDVFRAAIDAVDEQFD